MLTRKELTGPWAGLPVAWKQDWSFDEAAYRADVERTCKAGVPGVYTAGTSGEFYAMEMDEWQAVSRATVEVCKACDTPVMLGITSTYTLGARRRAEFAVELGADAVQVALPFWLEVKDGEVVSFFEGVADACPGLAVTVYETLRAKKSLTVDQHRQVREAVPAYQAVKANHGTIGCTPDGCRQLSEFVNVWVSETSWSELGPSGAIGCASALVYMNPRLILDVFRLLQEKNWDALAERCAMLQRYHEGLAPFAGRGFEDTAFDHLQGTVAGFLKMHPRSRGPYISCTEEDVVQFRRWIEQNVPEMLEL
jgi:dihydrodipicolinate synthase/N-acetylneuraminate lyase